MARWQKWKAHRPNRRTRRMLARMIVPYYRINERDWRDIDSVVLKHYTSKVGDARPDDPSL